MVSTSTIAGKPICYSAPPPQGTSRVATIMPDAMSQPQPALLVNSLSKRFGEAAALNGVSITVADGLCFGLLGPNGAGKSTLIRSIVGRARPDSGSVEVFGQPRRFASRLLLGWVPAGTRLYPLSPFARTWIRSGRYKDCAAERLNEAIAWCLEWAGLHDRANSVMKTLSGGGNAQSRCQRSSIALASSCSTSPRSASIRNRATGYSK